MKQAPCLFLLLFSTVAALAQSGGYMVTGSPVDTTTAGTHHHKEPVVIVDRVGGIDRITAAWISFAPSLDSPSARIQVAATTDLAHWQPPVTLSSPDGYGTTGDPFLALDQVNHTVYLVGAGGYNPITEIRLWKSSDFNGQIQEMQVCSVADWPFASEASKPYVDKPSAAVSPSGQIYVAHLIGNFGNGTILHIHRWNEAEDAWNVIALRSEGLNLHSPIVTVDKPPGTGGETISLIFDDYTSASIIAKDRIYAWSSPVEEVDWSSMDNRNPPTYAIPVAPPSSSSGSGFASVEVNNLMIRNSSIQTGTGELMAPSMLMARYNPVTGKIGIVWHQRERIPATETVPAEAGFVNFDPVTRAFGPLMPPAGTVLPGNQIHPAIEANPDGSYMVSYYDTPANYLNYVLKVSRYSQDGSPLEAISIASSASNPTGYSPPVGEYQDIRHSAGSWYASFIGVSGSCPACQGDTYVAKITPSSSCVLPRRLSVSPGTFVSRIDRPLVSVFGEWAGQFHYDWYERLPGEATPRLYYKHTSSIYVTPSQPLTYYSAVVRDSCGQSVSLAEVPIYLCVPTINAQPVADQFVPRGGSTNLTIAASPAIDGQPVTITWRSVDTGQIVGSGSTLSVTPAPGTMQTYLAYVSTDCSGIPFSLQSQAATVRGCELAATAYGDRTITLGQSAPLSSSISGTQVLPSDAEYTWYYGPPPGTEYASGVGLWMITPTPQSTTTYWVRVKDGTCTASSNTVTVRISAPRDAQVLSQNVPTTMTALRSYAVSATLKNVGTESWSPVGPSPQCNVFRLGSTNPQDNLTWGRLRADLPMAVAPGGQVTITFPVTAPAAPGTYNFQWKMLQECVTWFGDSTPNVAVNVQPAPPRDAQVLSQSVPTTMAAGQVYPVSVTLKNVGTETWSPIGASPQCNVYRLGSTNPRDNLIWGRMRADLPATVVPGGVVTVNFNVTAPSTPGTYNFQWKMLQECVTWFGDSTPNVVVNVQPAPVRDAQFLSQTVPSSMAAGQSYPVSLRVRNVGTQTWSPIGPQCNAYRLGSANPYNNATWLPATRVELPASLAPGGEVTLNFAVTAPTTTGTYNFQWQMVQECVTWFGDFTPNVGVTVNP
ncbi:MAG: NBR1-Ig-like domain-containing protein [Thermoanaerobaculia bacterium]